MKTKKLFVTDNKNHSNICTKLKESSFSSNINNKNINNDFLKTVSIYSIVIALLVVGIYTIDKKLNIFENIKKNIS